jgi:hypothetical protein
MNPLYAGKHWLKLARWQYRRYAAARRWGSEALQKTPIVLGNAMPKSGSHLIIQVLQGLTKLGAFVNPGFPPVNRSEDNRKLPEADVLVNLQRLRPGDIAYGYVHAREPFISELKRHGIATVFVYRDPRDVIVSHVFYATNMHKGHGMHSYYTEQLQTMEERINAAIRGVEEPGSKLTSIQAKYENYLGWLEEPNVLSMRFEDLILNRGTALGQILDYLETRGYSPIVDRHQAVNILEESIAPRRSGTFRKGQPGNWQEHFTEANKAIFKEQAGDLLVTLGYEKSANW